MVLSRLTDAEILYFKYCFKRAHIQTSFPNPFPLTGLLTITATDFSTNFEFFAILSSFSQAELRNYTHEEIILHIPYICNITSTEFDVYLIIGNQSSNSYQLNFGPPRVTYQPIPLSPSGETILLRDSNFSKMLNCYHNSSIEFSVSSATFEIVLDDEVNVRTG
ncbi:hypothetical protein GEMRC1_008724 [Eukaryota sp. GEM-RC1]